MKIIFTNHAKYRIYERKISALRVKETIQNPTSKKMDQCGMIVVKKNFGRKYLEVVYKVKDNKNVVITAYYEN